MRKSAYSAICWPQMPAALTTTGACSLITPLILMVVNAHARHPVAAAQQPHHLVVGQDLRAVFTRVQHVGGGQPEGIDGAVRHPHRADQRRVGRRLQAQRQLRVDSFSVDVGLATGGDKLLLIVQRVLRQG